MTDARTREVFAIVTLLGTWLVLPPMLSIMGGATELFGIPGVVVYLFVVWLALILLTAVVSRRVGGEARDGVPSAIDEPRAGRTEAGREDGA